MDTNNFKNPIKIPLFPQTTFSGGIKTNCLHVIIIFKLEVVIILNQLTIPDYDLNSVISGNQLGDNEYIPVHYNVTTLHVTFEGHFIELFRHFCFILRTSF